MAEVAACPSCAAQLSVPQQRPAGAHAQCPLCEETFSLDAAQVTRLRELRVVPAPDEPAPPAPFPAPQGGAPEKLSDWLDRAADERVETSSEEGVGDRDPGDQAPSAPGATDPEFSSRRTVADSPGSTAPSIESLLSRFRGAPFDDSDAPGDEASDEESEAAEAPQPEEQQRPHAAPAADFEFDIDQESEQKPHEDEPPPPEPPDADALQAVHRLATKGNGRRRRSVVTQLAGVALFGLLGVALGGYALLWIRGPQGDLLGVSRYLPAAMLPASFANNSAPSPPAPAGAPPESEPRAPRDESAMADARPAPIRDDAVDPATFQEPPSAPEPIDESTDSAEEDEDQDPRAARPRVTLVGAPSPYSLDQLDAAMERSEDARRVLSDNSLTENPSAGPEMGRAYAKLCELAQVLTFVDTSQPDPEIKRLAARDLYRRLFVYKHARDDSRDIATRWLKWTGRPHGGVFFAGDLQSMADKGSVWEFRLRLADGVQVTVLRDRPMDPQQFVNTMELGVVGCVVEDATNRVEGYTGDADRAVWACHTFRLTKPKYE